PLSPDDERVLDRARDDHPARDRERRDEAGAGRLHVEGTGPSRAQLRLHEAGGRRKEVVRRARANDHELHVLCAEVRLLERGASRARGHERVGFLVRGDATLLDAGATGDPLVGGVDDPLELGVGHYARRRIETQVGYELVLRDYGRQASVFTLSLRAVSGLSSPWHVS